MKSFKEKSKPKLIQSVKYAKYLTSMLWKVMSNKPYNLATPDIVEVR